jgi:GntR family transcriptional regulator
MDLTPPVARYQQVADRLRLAIMTGEYQPGEALPSETQLATQFGLNRTTINKAIRLLAAEGLVTVEHGRGSFVRQRRPVVHVSSAYVTQRGDEARGQWTSELERQGLRGTQIIGEVTKIAAPVDVAGWLGLDDEEEVIVRRRILAVDDQPVQLADSYYPARLADDTELSQPSKLHGGTIAALERLGVQLIRFHEEISVRGASPHEADVLQLAPGAPVIRHVRVSIAEGDQAVEVSEAIMEADRHVLTYDLPASHQIGSGT